MPSRYPKQTRFVLPVGAALALLAAATFAPAARADSSGSVEVFAAVATELTLTICDGEANFGTGLNSLGSTPRGTDDAVGVTTSAFDPNYVYYHWTPACQAAGGTPFLEGVSTADWRLSICATENTGEGASPTLQIQDGDLRAGVETESPYQSAEDADQFTTPFGLCDDGIPDVEPFAGMSFVPGAIQLVAHYYLKVHEHDAAGTFTTATTWTATPD